MNDPYLYPGTTTLKNCFNIKNAQALQELESTYYYLNLNKPFPEGKFDFNHLKLVHKHLFGNVYPWAGHERTVDISKGNSYFCRVAFISKQLNVIFTSLKNDNYLKNIEKPEFNQKLAHYFNEINAAHPFREGNGRTLRLFCEHLSLNASYKLRWEEADHREYIDASISGFNGDNEPMIKLLEKLVISTEQRIDSLDLSYAEFLTKDLNNHKKNEAQKNIVLNQKRSKRIKR